MNGRIQKSPGPRIAWNRPRRRTIARSHCCAIFGDCAAMMPAMIHGTIGRGWRMATAFSAPAPANPRNTNTEMMLPFCTSGSFHSAPQGRDDFLCRKPVRVAFRQHARRERFQPACVFGGGPRLGAPGTHERPHASTRLEHAGAFELAVHARDGVGVDLEVDR